MLRIYSTLQVCAELAIAGLQLCQEPFQAFRVWCWRKATAANLKSCNQRQPHRERFT
jgi:hypothetical protein